MSSFHLHLSGRHLPHPGLRKPSIPVIYHEILSLTWLLLISIGILWMNQPWVTGMWQLALFLFAACHALLLPRSVALSGTRCLLIACAIPLWGTIQMLMGRSAYNYASLIGSISWMTFPACMLLGLILLREHRKRDAFFSSLRIVAGAIIGLELYQLLFLGRYRVLSSGYPLMSSNLYAELAELLLPVVLATTLRKGSNFWFGSGLSAMLLGTAVAAGARMGSALLALEVVLILWAVRGMTGYRALTWRRHYLPMFFLFSSVLALQGTSELSSRMQEAHPMAGRSQVLESTLSMIREHPLTGSGMGSFAIVYPEYAHLDTTSFVNHVHDDVLEITAEGGAIGLLLWVAVLITSLPAVRKALWSFGVVAILAHGFTDFPLYRSPVLALMALLLAAAIARNGESVPVATRSTSVPLAVPVPIRAV